MDAFITYCMADDPTICEDMKIVQQDYSPASNPMGCMIGGAIYNTFHSEFVDREGRRWVNKGGVRCKQVAQTADEANSEIEQWVKEQELARRFNEPQTK